MPFESESSVVTGGSDLGACRSVKVIAAKSERDNGDADERRKVLLSADIGEPPPEGCEKLLRTMMEANNLFSRTAGATLALDAVAGRFRLQKYESPDELANDAEPKLVSFIETALFWSRSIAEFKPSIDEAEETRPGGFGMIPV